jgi:Tfp pilus assembly protein PilF
VIIGIYAGITWRQTGFWKDADTLYSRDLAVVKGNWHANMNLGTMLVERKRYDEGISRYQEALLNSPPSEANIFYNLGVAYEHKGDKKEAEKYYRLTVSLAPRRDSGYLGLARILNSNGDTAGALAIIREGMTHAQDTWLLLAKEAYLLHKAGDTAAAGQAYRQAIAKEPYATENYINLGILLAQKGNMVELQNVIDRLKRINPAEADNLARLLR